MQWCYVIQYGPYVGEFDKSKREVLFAIFWNAHKAGSVDTRGDNLISAIHGRAISPSLTQRAVYALQPDYSLRTIDLGAEDIARVFVLLKSYEGDFRDDDVWKSQVAPQLRVVEPPASPGVQD